MVRIKGWKRQGKNTWEMTTPSGKQFRIRIQTNRSGARFPYKVLVYHGRYIERHNEDSRALAEKRVTRLQKELSRRYHN